MLGLLQRMQGDDGRPIELFYSYSHEDEDYRRAQPGISQSFGARA